MTDGNTKIALLDTGVDRSHPFFKHHSIFCMESGDKYMKECDDQDGHGTHCAGVILNAAPMCTLLSICIMPYSGLFTYGALLDGLQSAVNLHADLICICSGDRLPDLKVQKVINHVVYSHQIPVIAAIGNKGDHRQDGQYPALFEEVIAVGSTDKDGQLTDFTELPAGIDLVCLPGIDVSSPWPGGGYQTHSGTSISSARLSGIIARWITELKRRSKHLNSLEIKKRIIEVCAPKQSSRGLYYYFDPVNSFKKL